jgi:lipoprotein-releasing system ATP-binding protein
MSDAVVLEVAGLGKRYVDGPREVTVLHDLDLSVGEAETLGIVGASGIGKSTLLHVLGTLDHPTTGRITIDGIDSTRLGPGALAAFRNRRIGFVFQFHQLLADFTALENVVMPARIARMPMRTAAARAEDLLVRVGLAERLHHRPGELSGGEQQRVAVARAVMCKPRLVLADEPTGNLDPVTGARVRDVLLELNRECGAALVVATHNQELARTMGRVLRLVDGRLAPIAAVPTRAAAFEGRS